jgi:hypothetical protein
MQLIDKIKDSWLYDIEIESIDDIDEDKEKLINF